MHTPFVEYLPSEQHIQKTVRVRNLTRIAFTVSSAPPFFDEYRFVDDTDPLLLLISDDTLMTLAHLYYQLLMTL
jgi:hypothetical protein